MDHQPDKPLTEVDATHLVREQFDQDVYDAYGRRIEMHEATLKAGVDSAHERLLLEGLIARLRLKRELMKGGVAERIARNSVHGKTAPYFNVGTIGHIDHGKSVVSQMMQILATKEALNRSYDAHSDSKPPILIVCDEVFCNREKIIGEIVHKIVEQGHPVQVVTPKALEEMRKGGMRRGELEVISAATDVGRSQLNNLCEDMLVEIDSLSRMDPPKADPKKILIVDSYAPKMTELMKLCMPVPCEWPSGRARIGKGERKSNRRDRWKGPQGSRRY